MSAMIVYDSVHGNTAKIAQAMAKSVGVQVCQVGDVNPADLADLECLVVGSPTHGGWFTEEIKALLEAMPNLEGVQVAAFDTRTASVWNRILPFGYAAPRMANMLEDKGGTLIQAPEGFVVEGIKGPLKDGELERAASWAKGLVD